MAERELPTKFPMQRFPTDFTDGRRTTDGRRLRHDSSSADKVKQS